MHELRGRVAVVTGAASGIGRALTEHFAREGMRVVLADVERLAQHALEAYGAVHVVCNNAGVAATGTLWEQPLENFEWVLGGNL